MSLPRGFLGRFFLFNDSVSLLINGSKELYGPPDMMIDLRQAAMRGLGSRIKCLSKLAFNLSRHLSRALEDKLVNLTSWIGRKREGNSKICSINELSLRMPRAHSAATRPSRSLLARRAALLRTMPLARRKSNPHSAQRC